MHRPSFRVLSRWLFLLQMGVLMAFRGVADEGAPSVIVQPVSQTNNLGATVTFTVTVTGNPPFQYQWRKDGTALDGATNSTLTLTNIVVTDHGGYSVAVGNPVGSATSEIAQLEVTAPPLFTSTPTDTVVFLGQTAVFGAEVYSAAPAQFQWLLGAVALAGQTNRTLLLTNVTSTNAGTYYLTVSNPSGSTSTFASLTVRDLPAPALRFGQATFADGHASFPVFFTAHGTETNLSFSLGFDPAIYTNATFSPYVIQTICACSTQVIIDIPPVVLPFPTNGPAGGQALPAALPETTSVGLDTTQLTNGRLGVNITLPADQAFAPGEDRIGLALFDLVSGAPNIFAGRVGFTGQPLPLMVAPPIVGATNTDGVVLTSPAPPVFTGMSNGPALNPQTGLFDQVVELVNPGAGMLDDVFTVVGLLGVDSRTNAIRNQNAHGHLVTGESYVDTGALAPGETRRLTLEYFVPDLVTAPSPALTSYGSALSSFTPPDGTFLAVTTNRFVNGGFLVEFPTKASLRYYVQYATNAADFAGTNSAAIRTALPAVAGTGGNVQWLDNGPPKTIASPTDGGRFYRVLETR